MKRAPARRRAQNDGIEESWFFARILRQWEPWANDDERHDKNIVHIAIEQIQA